MNFINKIIKNNTEYDIHDNRLNSYWGVSMQINESDTSDQETLQSLFENAPDMIIINADQGFGGYQYFKKEYSTPTIIGYTCFINPMLVHVTIEKSDETYVLDSHLYQLVENSQP